MCPCFTLWSQLELMQSLLPAALEEKRSAHSTVHCDYGVDRWSRRTGARALSWNAMISGLAEQGLGHEAFSLFLEMQRERIALDAISYLSILNPCSSAGAVEWLKEVHTHASGAVLDEDVRVANALVQMYAKTGLIANAKQVFEKMRIRSAISWNVMIDGWSQNRDSLTAVPLDAERRDCPYRDHLLNPFNHVARMVYQTALGSLNQLQYLDCKVWMASG